MKVQYDKARDILLIQLTHKRIDTAYETGNMLVHITKNREPVLLEIFNARRFFAQEGKVLPEEIKEQYFTY